MTARGNLLRPDVLEESYCPREIQAREEQLDQLRKCLAPARRGMRPIHALLVGPPGTGKTALTLRALKDLRRVSIPCVYVDCWRCKGLHSMLERVVEEVGIEDAQRNSAAFKIEAIGKGLRGKPLVVVLDEIDKLPPRIRRDTLHGLLAVPKAGLICVVQQEYFFESLPNDLKARLCPRRINFQRYESAAVVEILRDRCRQALARGYIETGLLQEIASRADGNARQGLEILRATASLAQQRGASTASQKFRASYRQSEISWY